MHDCHKDFFHTKGLKNTPTRDWVYHTLTHKALTAEDVYLALLKQKKKIVFSTIYRILEQFSEHGITERLFLDNENKTRYQLKEEHDDHVHQLICTQCHEVVNLSTCPVEGLTQDIQKASNFKIVYHQLRFYGLCQKCRA